MFYYFIPRCAVAGTITVDGHALPAKGDGWYDHEFGGHRAEGEQNDAAENEQRIDMAWNWAAVQLGNGVDVTAYALQRVADGKVLHRWAVMSDASGKQRSFLDMELTPGKSWRSTRTFYDYPVEWKLSIPSAQLELTLDAAFVDQEFITCISKPAFWEGRIQARGTFEGREVDRARLRGALGLRADRGSRSSSSPPSDRRCASRWPACCRPSPPTSRRSSWCRARSARTISTASICRSWGARSSSPFARSPIAAESRGARYAALACCDVVEGDSRKFVQWLAMPELLHVGSLIVDDVQDRSTVRRGGPAAHVVHGEPLAINAGTAAYFLTQRSLFSEEISPKQKLGLYDLYFEAMRAGHAGQAIDLDGLHPALELGGRHRRRRDRSRSACSTCIA